MNPSIITTLISRLSILALAAIVLVRPPLVAAEPVIIAPDEPVPVGGLCLVRVEGIGPDDQFQWQAIPSNVQVADLMTRDGSPVLLVATNKEGVVNLVLGYYLANGEDDGEGRLGLKVVTVQIGEGVPIPPPDPDPKPDPEPDPEPEPPESGKRTLVLVYESANADPAFARMITNVRNRPHSTYLIEQGHKLALLDDDAVDETGNPPAILEQWRPQFEEMDLPALFIVDKETGGLVHKQELSVSTTAEELINIVKEHD